MAVSESAPSQGLQNTPSPPTPASNTVGRAHNRQALAPQGNALPRVGGFRAQLAGGLQTIRQKASQLGLNRLPGSDPNALKSFNRSELWSEPIASDAETDTYLLDDKSGRAVLVPRKQSEETSRRLRAQVDAVTNLKKIDPDFPVVGVHALASVVDELCLLVEPVKGVTSDASTLELLRTLTESHCEGAKRIRQLLWNLNLRIENFRLIFETDGRVRVYLPTVAQDQSYPSQASLNVLDRIDRVYDTLRSWKPVAKSSRALYLWSSKQGPFVIELSGCTRQELKSRMAGHRTLDEHGFPLVKIKGVVGLPDGDGSLYGMQMEWIPGAVSSTAEPDRIKASLTLYSVGNLLRVRDLLVKHDLHVPGMEFLMNYTHPPVMRPLHPPRPGVSRENLDHIDHMLTLCLERRKEDPAAWMTAFVYTLPPELQTTIDCEQAEAVETLRALGFPVVNIPGLTPPDERPGITVDRLPDASTDDPSPRLRVVINDQHRAQLVRIDYLLRQYKLEIHGFRLIFQGDKVGIDRPSGLSHDTDATKSLELIQQLLLIREVPVPNGYQQAYRSRQAVYLRPLNYVNGVVAMAGRSLEDLTRYERAYESLEDAGFPRLATIRGKHPIGGDWGAMVEWSPGAVISTDPDVASRLNVQSIVDLEAIRPWLEKYYFPGIQLIVTRTGRIRLAPVLGSEARGKYRDDIDEVKRLISLATYQVSRPGR
jgi:hypothetical protein